MSQTCVTPSAYIYDRRNGRYYLIRLIYSTVPALVAWLNLLYTILTRHLFFFSLFSPSKFQHLLYYAM
jgi:hypothetical protein